MDAFSSSLAAAALVDGQHFSLPGFGTIEGIYVPAWINHVNREVDPPRLEVRWTRPAHPDAQTFADLLVGTGATYAEASATQDAWLATLEAGEAVSIGDLGLLRFDEASGLVEWLPYEAALAAAYWRGGAVAVEPLPKRNASVSAEEPVEGAFPGAEAKVVALAEADGTDESGDAAYEDQGVASGRSQPFPLAKLLRYAAMFGLVVVGLALLRSAFAEQIDAPDDGQAVAVSQDRLNRSPLDASSAPVGVVAEDFVAPEYNAAYGPSGAGGAPSMQNQALQAPKSVAAEPADAKPATARANTPPSNVNRLPRNAQRIDPADLASVPEPAKAAKATKVGKPVKPAKPAKSAKARQVGGDVVIILGSFESNDNAARLTERLAAKGLLPYVDQPGKLTRVGVSVSDVSPAEASAMLARLKREFNPNAWIL